MKYLRRFIREAFDKGGVLVVGVGCLFLCKQQYAPNILGPLSYGFISAGAIGVARYIIMDFNKPAVNEDYQQIIAMLDQRAAEIQENRKKLEQLKEACESFMAMRQTLEGWRRDPSLVQDKVTILEELLKPREVGTSLLASKGSSQGTPSDMPTVQESSSPSQKGADTGSGETTVKVVEYELPEDISEEALEGIIHKAVEEIIDDVLEDLSEEVLEEESGRILENISNDVQEEMYKRMQAEFPEIGQWEVSEKSMEEIIENIQKDLFDRVEGGTPYEIVEEETFEIVQDVPEGEQGMVIKTAQGKKPQTVQKKVSQTEITKRGQDDMSEKGVVKIQAEEESKNLLQVISGNAEGSALQENLQLRPQNVEKLEKQQDKGMVTAEIHIAEQRSLEKLEMEIAEALLEPESTADEKS